MQLEHRTVIPEPGVVNPATGEHFLITSDYSDTTIGSTGNLTGWFVSHAGEIVAGDWTLEIGYQGRLLGSCRFHVRT